MDSPYQAHKIYQELQADYAKVEATKQPDPPEVYAANMKKLEHEMREADRREAEAYNNWFHVGRPNVNIYKEDERMSAERREEPAKEEPKEVAPPAAEAKEETFEEKRARMRREAENPPAAKPELSFEEKRRQIYVDLHKQYARQWMQETKTWYPVDNP